MPVTVSELLDFMNKTVIADSNVLDMEVRLSGLPASGSFSLKIAMDEIEESKKSDPLMDALAELLGEEGQAESLIAHLQDRGFSIVEADTLGRAVEKLASKIPVGGDDEDPENAFPFRPDECEEHEIENGRCVACGTFFSGTN